MQQTLIRIVVALFFVSLLVPMVGCSDDGSKSNKRRRRTAKKKVKATRSAAGEADGLKELKNIPRKLRNVDWSASEDLTGNLRNSRDPFKPFVEDLRVKAEDPKNQAEVTKIKTAIGTAQVDELTLTAVITGTTVHRAMVRDNRGLGHFIKPGDVVGTRPPMRVARITRNEVLFRALEKKADEKQPLEIRKVLLSKEELQEFLP